MIEVDGKKRTVCIWIPARGGSKGVPGKALRDLGGKPLIAHTIQSALEVPGARVLVNTDNDRIAAEAEKWGACVPFLRPARLARDESSLEDVRNHLWKWYADKYGQFPDIEIVMNPTHPFRRRNLIMEALGMVLGNSHLFNIGSVAPVDVMRDNFWIREGSAFTRFQYPRKSGGGGTCLFSGAFSFNIVFNFRYREGLDRRVPFCLNEVEAIDIDEPVDLVLARMVMAEGIDSRTSCQRSAPSEGREDHGVFLFGKEFKLNPDCGHWQFLRHEDYPMISESDIEFFREYALGKKDKIVVSGCRAKIHPYRLMGMDDDGYDYHIADIPQAIRGHRQAYPEVYQYVPALVAVPPHKEIPKSLLQDHLDMFTMAPEKLLDKQKATEALLIKYCRNTMSAEDNHSTFSLY